MRASSIDSMKRYVFKLSICHLAILILFTKSDVSILAKASITINPKIVLACLWFALCKWLL